MATKKKIPEISTSYGIRWRLTEENNRTGITFSVLPPK